MKKLMLINLSCCFISCTNNIKPALLPDKHELFPVNSFLKGQVHVVDSLKLPVHKYSTVDNRTDSVLISREEFDSLANEFIEPDINNPTIKKFYKETSFADQSIPAVTFTYSTLNKDLPLQRVDVIVNPDPILNDQVKSIYLEKIINTRDTSVIKKLYWKTNKYFQIITSKQASGQPATFSEVKVAWNAAD